MDASEWYDEELPVAKLPVQRGADTPVFCESPTNEVPPGPTAAKGTPGISGREQDRIDRARFFLTPLPDQDSLSPTC